GMCEHGRILHHLKNNVEDERNTVMIIGFQAQHTLGRRIVERQRELKILGVKRQLNAQVKIINEFSAHAGRSDLIAFGARFKGQAERILLVHGEPAPLAALKSALEAEGVTNVGIQEEGVPVTV
ncbi:MAG: MBL fold metallo-hydrolase, partial [Candidatus Hydrogenedentes bacterium]|nr:MBL fold metallo-hydrolase [Candidatus Hydrogenedentota bacterium]